jgi:hypothetical protein
MIDGIYVYRIGFGTFEKKINRGGWHSRTVIGNLFSQAVG